MEKWDRVNSNNGQHEIPIGIRVTSAEIRFWVENQELLWQLACGQRITPIWLSTADIIYCLDFS